MTRRSKRALFLVPFVALALAGPAHARDLRPADAPIQARVADRLRDLAGELGLSDEQMAQIRDIADDARALLTAEQVDRAAVEAHRQEVLDLVDDASALIADALVSAAEVLTPDQRAALAERIEDFRASGGWRARLRDRWLAR